MPHQKIEMRSLGTQPETVNTSHSQGETRSLKGRFDQKTTTRPNKNNEVLTRIIQLHHSMLAMKHAIHEETYFHYNLFKSPVSGEVDENIDPSRGQDIFQIV